MAATSMALALQFACRAKDGVHLRSPAAAGDVLDLASRPTSSAKTFRYSHDGALFAWSTNDSFVVVDANTAVTVLELPLQKVVDFVFSPSNTFIATWQRPLQLEGSDRVADNLFVFKLDGGERLLSVFQRNMSNWAPQWTDDEALMTRCVTNELQIYDGHTISTGVRSRIHLEGVVHAELAPGNAPYKVALFAPEKKGLPASVKMFACEASAAPIAFKSFFKADKVQMLWNNNGTKVLVLTQTEVDTSGKSYFGETNLYYLDANGKFDCHVNLDKEGPIHEVCWSPNCREFIVVYGFMPAKAKLFDSKCNPIFDFGAGSRNTIKYNPQGTIICLAGFGNLAGEMELWSRESLTRISVINARDTTYFEWCPDGRHLLNAILSPRLRVDNGYRVFHYNGQVVAQDSFPELYQVTWRPGTFPVRPLSPPPPASQNTSSAASSSSTSSSSAPAVSTSSAPVVKAAYVPPHLRNQAGTAAPTGTRKLHELLHEEVDVKGSKAKEEEEEDEKTLSKNALKNKKKRDNKKESVAAASASSSTASSSSSKKPSSSSPAAAAVAAVNDDDSELDKKIKSLTKKLKQIEALKEQQSEGKKLELNQLEKIKSYDALAAELRELNKQNS